MTTSESQEPKKGLAGRLSIARLGSSSFAIAYAMIVRGYAQQKAALSPQSKERAFKRVYHDIGRTLLEHWNATKR